MGARLVDEGVNFALFSRHAAAVSLLLYDGLDAPGPGNRIDLDPANHRDGDIWHIWVADVRPGTAYAYRVDGRYDVTAGLRFNPRRVVIDPYASALTGVSDWDFAKARGYDASAQQDDVHLAYDDNEGYTARGLVVDNGFDWQGDRPLKHPWPQTIIYETHVRGFTADPSSGVQHPGTYRGLIEKIPYLRGLGVTAVELLPVHEFNEHELVRVNPLTGKRLHNYWGYSTVGFFAPKEGYASQTGAQVSEFKEMVRALHAAGIEVILDVVFNHTAEGNELGPTLSFRGIDNPIYYLLEDDPRYYKNYTGCGNTLNCNHPVVRDFVLDCLRYWAIEMHVDGFRFDLASVLGRDEHGNMISNPPLLERIAEDPILRDVKLIAEAWDAAGAWQVGRFASRRWSEWNCHFRDEVRRFWRGDTGMRGGLASRLCGSADLYQSGGKQPLNSINLITCHDGFTLNDLVSYERKHNEANGENNRDGTDANWNANYGVEGETDDPQIEALRLRQLKNLIATLMLSRGVPMLLGGDEFRRSQSGNNNAYCQDNELSWVDWRLVERNSELLRFTREMIGLRQRHSVLCAESFYESKEITWFEPEGRYPDWHSDARTLGCSIHGMRATDGELCLLFNAEPHAVEFRLPDGQSGRAWRVTVNTGESAPHDVRNRDCPLLDGQSRLTLADRTLAVLMC
ncbi:glycogen debranching protein [Candidatus Tenderia electrophaga]|uniref:Glycogen debranching protein n=1 Tax=Candidatus Tenderia electrophaga TaxID=1748243 RepID=A0A0S2TID9_9GAMM|nr:glycogen debranching protein [Candidatus Tenderia electrophaga]